MTDKCMSDWSLLITTKLQVLLSSLWKQNFHQKWIKLTTNFKLHLEILYFFVNFESLSKATEYTINWYLLKLARLLQTFHR